ncbi:hypothetical protein ACKF11_13820 [Methylobacillus sp. Pita2]|uniref:type IVB secretion system protein IcmW n=1 Tax=Methylobacillus sp. Pita2 TaxID=3383245 RepID=UPI0038B41F81
MNDTTTSQIDRPGNKPVRPIYMDEHQLSSRWQEDIRLYSIMVTMDAVESWVVNDPRIEAAIQKLGETIENNGDAIKIGSACRDFLLILAHMKTGRAMHIMNCLDERFTGAGLKLVQTAVSLHNHGEFDYPEGKLMVERLDVLRKLRTLGRVFSHSRLRFVIRALQEVKNDDK